AFSRGKIPTSVRLGAKWPSRRWFQPPLGMVESSGRQRAPGPPAWRTPWHERCDLVSAKRAESHVPVRRGAQGKETMNPRHYVDLKETDRNLQPTYYFMINCLLYSRMETGLVSNQDFYDEDVNVYLAHLLHSFINPEYVEQSKKFLSKYDTDVFRRLSNSTDSRLKYLIYK